MSVKLPTMRFMVYTQHWLIEVLKAVLEGSFDSNQDPKWILF